MLLTRFFPAAFTCHSLLDAFFFARLEVKRVPFDLFNNVLLLNIALKAPQGIFEGFSLLDPNFCQN